MNSLNNWTALIPCRAGSKGLPGKNIRLLAGRPLYQHSVDIALKSGASRIIISTDIPDIFTANLPTNVELLSRPVSLSRDDTPINSVLEHAIEYSDITGTVVLLQPTSPLRAKKDIRDALVRFTSSDHELVMSVTAADPEVLKWGRLHEGKFMPLADPEFCFANRQSLPRVFRPNGAIYVFDAGWFMRNKSLTCNRIGVIVMPNSRSQDIDNLVDFLHCEEIILSKQSNN